MMRIVSLLAAATEIIAELGCLDQLVGCSHECDYPEQIRQLPVVSKTLIDTNTSSAQIDAQVKQVADACNVPPSNALKALSVYTIDTQLLQRLQPDVIITQTQCDVCAVNQADVELALQQTLGLRPRIVALAPYDLQDVWQSVLLVGAALDRDAQAHDLVASYQQRLTRLQEHTQALIQQAGRKPRVAVLEWLDPLMGAGNWTPELVAYAGGENIFGSSGAHSPWLNWEELAAADPDVIILSPCGYTLERTQQDIPLLQQHPGWKNLRAVKQERVYALDGNAYINRSGPRLVESAALIARAIWGSRLNIDVIEEAYQQITA